MNEAQLGLGLVCIVLAASANLLGGAVVAARDWGEAFLRYAVALSAGFMLAAVLLKMLPESTRLTPLAPGLALGGYLLITSSSTRSRPTSTSGRRRIPRRSPERRAPRRSSASSSTASSTASRSARAS